MILRALKMAWVLAAVLALALVLGIAFFSGGKPSSDVEGLILSVLLLVLSFPVVWLASLFLLTEMDHMVHAMTGHWFLTSYTSLTVFWLMGFIGGYVQWFVLLPWALRKLRRK